MSIDIRGTTRLAGVMGWPVKQSQSPQLHNYWLARHAIDGAYVPLPVRPEDLSRALRALPALGFAGVNLTLPHKEAALAIVDRVEPVTKRIGAANLIVVAADGTLEARNSDVYGFIEHLRAAAPAWNPRRPAVILGAGGAARSVVVSLMDAGVPEIRIVNRTRARAEALKALGAQVKVDDWPAGRAMLADAGLLANTTLLGMTGQASLEIDLEPLPKTAVVCDIVYVPLETGLLAKARARGHVAVDGLGMLLHQARPAFRAFFGVDPQVTDELRAHVLASKKE
jgi:shikimate dehydrogenase